ncbi:MAG: hypothetical protein AAFQ64_02320 [Pseudomonadota bacterium]
MPVLADTHSLITDAVISPAQATEIESRARQLMVNAGINIVLCAGVLAATLGLIAYLADPFAVAFTGILMLVAGLFVLHRSPDVYRMFGNAAALIGSGMLIGGSFTELLTSYEQIAGTASFLLGLPIILLAGRSLLVGGLTARFVAGSIFLMGIALHLAGVGLLLDRFDISGLPLALGYVYAAIIIAISGWVTDTRAVTALALVPFAQMLDTSTSYLHAAYVFYSPESTLSILQMTLLVCGCLWLLPKVGERTGRHLRITAVMGFVVANLCALVGSLWGDKIGSHIWGPRAQGVEAFDGDWTAYHAATDAFDATAFTISADIYSALWALALVTIIFAASHKGLRGLFNASVTFLAIHAYTQAFESFYDEPLAYVIGGFVAIPMAWGMWRMNQRFTSPA